MSTRLPHGLRLVVGLAAAGAVASWLVSSPPEIFADFFKSYYPAGAATWQGGQVLARLYEANRLFNPPIAAWLFAPFAALPHDVAGMAFLAVGLACVLSAVRLLAADGAAPHPTSLLAATFLLNGALVYSLREGNSSHLALFGLVAALGLHRRGRDLLAGMLIALCSILKLPLVVLIPFFAARREWRVMGSATLTLVVAIALGIIAFGARPTVLWLDILDRFSGGPIAAYNSQSIHAFVVRLVTGPRHLANYWPLEETAGLLVLRYVSLATLLASLAAAAIAARGWRSTQATFGLTMTTALVFSPSAWTHYYCLLLIPLSMFITGQLGLLSHWTARLIAIVIALAAMPVLNPELVVLDGPVSSRILGNLTALGALLFWILLVRTVLREHLRSTPDAQARAGNQSAWGVWAGV